MQCLFLLLLLFSLSVQIRSAGICIADQPGTCSGTNKYFQCLSNAQQNCPSLSITKVSTTLQVSSWTGLDKCTNYDPAVTGACNMHRPKLATGDLNGDGLLDVVVASMLGGSGNRDDLTTFEILLMINTGSSGAPSFTTVPRDQSHPYVDPFKGIRDNQADCGCAGGKSNSCCAISPGAETSCCSNFFRKDSFANKEWANGELLCF